MTNETIITALREARAVVHNNRNELADAHTHPVTNLLDADGQAGVDEYDAVLRKIDEAMAAVIFGGQKPVAYKVNWPAEISVGSRRFYGADEWENSRKTVEFLRWQMGAALRSTTASSTAAEAAGRPAPARAFHVGNHRGDGVRIPRQQPSASRPLA